MVIPHSGLPPYPTNFFRLTLFYYLPGAISFVVRAAKRVTFFFLPAELIARQKIRRPGVTLRARLS